jgi:zinc/manganese transport system substrate-binding protein
MTRAGFQMPKWSRSTVSSLLGLILVSASGQPAWADGAKLSALVTLPELGVLVLEIAPQGQVEVSPLLKAGDDPHYQDASPAMTARAARADLLCQIGLELESGWLGAVVKKSANPRLRAGSTGDCVLARAVQLRDQATGPVDRSMGHVHPGGNPHFYLSLRSLAEASKEVEARLIGLLPNARTEINERGERLRARLNKEADLLAEAWKGIPDRDRVIIQYHREFDYLFADLGLRVVGAIEELPGRAPSAGQLVKVSTLAKSEAVRLVVAGASSSVRHLARFEELSGLKVIRLPGFLSPARMTLEGLLSLHRDINETLLAALKTK